MRVTTPCMSQQQLTRRKIQPLRYIDFIYIYVPASDVLSLPQHHNHMAMHSYTADGHSRAEEHRSRQECARTAVDCLETQYPLSGQCGVFTRVCTTGLCNRVCCCDLLPSKKTTSYYVLRCIIQQIDTTSMQLSTAVCTRTPPLAPAAVSSSDFVYSSSIATAILRLIIPLPRPHSLQYSIRTDPGCSTTAVYTSTHASITSTAVFIYIRARDVS